MRLKILFQIFSTGLTGRLEIPCGGAEAFSIKFNTGHLIILNSDRLTKDVYFDTYGTRNERLF